MGEPNQEPEQPRRTYCPAVDIYQTPDVVVLVADLPGVSKEDLSVQVEQNVLTIAGKVAAGEQVGRPRQREFEPGDFYRAFTLSNEVDPADIEATFTAGVLELRVPHRRPVEGRQIDVTIE